MFENDDLEITQRSNAASGAFCTGNWGVAGGGLVLVQHNTCQLPPTGSPAESCTVSNGICYFVLICCYMYLNLNMSLVFF